MSDDGSGLGLVLEFDASSDSVDFVRGFEMGRLHELLGRFAAGETIHADDPPGETIHFLHASNAEMILRIADLDGLEARSKEYGGDWLHVTFRRPA